MKIPTLVVLCVLFFAVVQQTSATTNCERVLDEDTTAENPPIFPAGESQNPPEIVGEWVSYECETRPGYPHYQLRKVVFDSPDAFGIETVYYRDESCITPFLTATYGGTYQFTGVSETTVAGYNFNLHYQQGEITPHADQAVEWLNSAVAGTCGVSNVGSVFSRGVTVPVTQTGGCSLLGIDLPSTHYQLFRITFMYHNGLWTHLQFGQDPSDGSAPDSIAKRATNYFPHWLVPVSECEEDGEGDEGAICRAVNAANEQNPPIGRKVLVETTPRYNGRWVSKQCESVPYSIGGLVAGLFVIREYEFDNAITWQTFYYYSDPTCNIKAFTTRYRGTYVNEGLSSELQSTHNFEYVFTQAWLTPTSPSYNQLFNAHCGNGQWQENVEREVSNDGCEVVGVVINPADPQPEYDVVSMRTKEYNLYFGQRPSSGLRPTDPEQRPKAYQLPAIGELECYERASASTFSTSIFMLASIVLVLFFLY
mmetsp:Transcript_8138/g.12368  ORF Transcript_8138/g.12368 Transcript_8138/m.12368 type:complete len:480 (+) Transcript_8138:18-1457(+)|eukprot:CAMPEP_0201546178 /NCGR_PEP_ID=MMETSP0173_2-20130828/2548_1 /ASSEMBLY_ACC=CAM_ASM_000268 /TAXON_ID=218659 /ORGANISM="Vexillifera sp., Strain DIVA3 564/2" /LENGTH=479 /DNA_ID=CAMNT_0047954785 /DNA_START=649 /DNA_END=2088 /DNA_ORIENTATION=-